MTHDGDSTTTDANTSDRVIWVQYLALVGYSVMSGLCILLLAYLRLNRHVAFRGDERATRKLILPAFEPLLVVLAVETAGFATFTGVSLSVKRYTTHLPAIDGEVYYAGRQFVFVTVIVFMLQKSVSVPALRRTILVSLLLASFTIPVVWFLSEHYSEPSHTVYWVTVACRRLLLLLYVFVFFRPPTRASVKSIRAYCVYIVLYHCIAMTSTIIMHYDLSNTAATITSCTVVVWGSLCPLWIWHVLRADTEYWRGMGQRACALQANFRQRRAINEHLSSRGLHVLIEMHRKYVIDFAHLEVKSRIGIGSSATVFSGLLKSQRPVAIKTYKPSSFTEETVAQFSHEAAFCATLHHPNIVEFIGMCVSPPTISLVAELCKATLEDLLFAQALRAQNEQQLAPLSYHRRSRDRRGDAQDLLRVAYMLDAARAVAYLHNFSPPLLHRDLKPANFLVDSDNNVKLADFGESRRLPRIQVPASYFEQERPSQQEATRDSGGLFSQHPTSFDPHGAVALRQAAPAAMMTVTGTVHYMPPEMIRGRSGLAAYGQAADVFSLAMTLWDILYPQQSKYPEIRDNANHFLVLENVLSGSRPEFDVDVHPKLRDLITAGWHADPNCRPSAQQFVSVLESLQEEVLAGLASELSDDFDRSTATGTEEQQSIDSICSIDMDHVSSFGPNALPHVRTDPHNNCFTGEYAVERMEVLYDVDPQSGEGVRLGNALMDAGFLHHSTHSLSFEVCGTATYFFDSNNIQFCQPVAILEEKCRFDGDDSSSETLFSPSIQDGGDGGAREFRIDASTHPPPSVRTNATQTFKQRSRSRLLSRLASTFSSVTTSGGASRKNMAQGCYDYYQGRCLCRRFGQRLEAARSTPHARKERQERANRAGISPSAIAEVDEDALMRKLLADDSAGTREDSEGGFVQVVTPAA